MSLLAFVEFSGAVRATYSTVGALPATAPSEVACHMDPNRSHILKACVGAGPVCELRASERSERVQWAATHCPGGCNARVLAITAGNAAREAHPVQDQRQDLGLGLELQSMYNVQLFFSCPAA